MQADAAAGRRAGAAAPPRCSASTLHAARGRGAAVGGSTRRGRRAAGPARAHLVQHAHGLDQVSVAQVGLHEAQQRQQQALQVRPGRLPGRLQQRRHEAPARARGRSAADPPAPAGLCRRQGPLTARARKLGCPLPACDVAASSEARSRVIHASRPGCSRASRAHAIAPWAALQAAAPPALTSEARPGQGRRAARAPVRDELQPGEGEARHAQRLQRVQRARQHHLRPRPPPRRSLPAAGRRPARPGARAHAAGHPRAPWSTYHAPPSYSLRQCQHHSRDHVTAHPCGSPRAS